MSWRRLRICLVLVISCACTIPVAAQRVDWPTESPPPPLLTQDIVFPDYEIRQLENGLQVVYVGAHEQPVVNVRLLVRAGVSSDSTVMPGVATLAAQMLDQGTTYRGAQELAETIDNIGGALGVGAGGDWSFINLIVMKDSFDLSLEMLSEIARFPTYAESEVERQRQQILSGMQVSYEDPAYVAGLVFGRLVYGFHPYGVPLNGTPASLSRITRNDLLSFHQEHYVPNNAILAVVGDVTAKQAFEGVEQALADWPKGPLPVPMAIEPPQPAHRLVIIDKPGAVQTAVRAGHLALPRAHPDHLALDLAIKILGGEGGNRLGGVLRSERSLTYAASADINGRQFSGDFLAETDTRSSATAEVLRVMVDEIMRMQREPVSERELSNAKSYLTGNFPLTIESPNAIAARILEAMLYGLNLDGLETYPDRINAITAVDIRRVAQAYLKPEALSIVLVGDVSTFRDNLPGVGFDSFEVVPISDLDITAVDLLRPSG